MRHWFGIAMVASLGGCAGELTAGAALVFSMSLAAWIFGRERQRRALMEAHQMRLAITSGHHRDLEQRFRQELALAEAGEAVSPERQWSARFQLAGLLLAEWRLDEAREVYAGAETHQGSMDVRALATFGRHELALVTETVDEDRLNAIRQDRVRISEATPVALREGLDRAWDALEGLCLERLGRHRAAIPLLEQGLAALEFNPARVIYLYHLGEAYERTDQFDLAADRYKLAEQAFPGTRLASAASGRLRSLGPSTGGQFRRMLPETPEDQ